VNASSREAPLAGIRVVDLTQWYAGPLATSWMGEMGADVVKIERKGVGDPTRGVDRVLPSELSSYFAGLNRSKRSIELDLSEQSDLDALRRLIDAADVLVENFRPGVMQRLGLGYDDVSARNEKLIYCSISSFGSAGPLVAKPGMDIVLQAMGGVMGLTGPAEGPPYRVGAPVADYVGAHQAFSSVNLALFERERSGRGQRVEVSLLSGQVAMLSNYMPGFFVTGHPDGPVGNYHPQLVPYQPYETSDHAVIVACLTEEFWRKMCVALGLDHLLDDERFALNADRVAHRDALNALLDPTFAAMTGEEVITRLEAADVPCAPVLSMTELTSHPQVIALELVVDVEHPDAGTYRVAAAPFGLTESTGRAPTAAPRLGEHTAEILKEIDVHTAG
jgi:crotonobetainyl-CoA:carnitine CoA-transferase CaiB-like acyl-CoA transferase